jgi:hypothetical protein
MVTRLLLVIGVAFVGLVAAVPTAHAETPDEKFLAKLKSQDITDQISPAHLIEAGHFACVELDNGGSPVDVLQDVMHSSGLPEYHSGFFVGASIDAYCPRHRDEIPRG